MRLIGPFFGFSFISSNPTPPTHNFMGGGVKNPHKKKKGGKGK